ncbi:hypothetical protein TcWFU_000912 [Taenia crassiceps]|uniref:Fibronectin type-III domain-containing protein n=1 Tax=Taenia crassiceps TaxID=6207 RepID=A0ABR4QFT6_9CEST
MAFGPQGPSSPTVTAVSRTEVIVSWEPPDQLLRAQLESYEVYINTSAKPIYSGTQTFCHLRGLQADCQYHFKVRTGIFLASLLGTLNSTCSLQSQILMVLKRETNRDKTIRNSKIGTPGAGKGKYHGEKFRSPSSTQKRQRQTSDKWHIPPETDKMDCLDLIAPGHSIYRSNQTGKSTSLPSLRLKDGSRDSQRCMPIANSVRRFPTKGISLIHSEF